MGIKDYIDVQIQAKGKSVAAKIQKGCSFENNNSIYHVTNEGKLTVFDKQKKTWTNTNLIKMTGYQYSVFEAVANNEDEKYKNKSIGDVVLSKKDIDKSLEQYELKRKNKNDTSLKDDLSKKLPMGYKIDNSDLLIYSKYNTVSAYIDGGKEDISGNVLIGYGSQKSAQIVSEVAGKSKEVQSSVKTNYTSASISVEKNKPKANDVKTKSKSNTTKTSTKKHYYDRSKTTPLPQYFQKKVDDVRKKMKLSQKTFDKYVKDVARHVGYSEYFIRCVIASEGYEPVVKNTKDGAYTGGFGHTNLIDKKVKLGKMVSPEQAFKWLKSDIKFMEKKVKELKLDENGEETLGTYFDKLPLSMKEAMLDVAFNRDHRKLANAEEYKSLRANIKNGEEYLPACAVRLRQDFSKYTHSQRLGQKHTTGLMERNCYRFLLAIRDFDDEYRAIAQKRFENSGTLNYYQETLSLKRKKGYPLDAKALTEAWNSM